jgi:hypothetical protein
MKLESIREYEHAGAYRVHSLSHGTGYEGNNWDDKRIYELTLWLRTNTYHPVCFSFDINNSLCAMFDQSAL